MTKNRIMAGFAASLLVLGAVNITACSKGKDAKKAEEKKGPGRVAQAVSIAQVATVTINPEIVVAGTVQPQNEAQVFPTASGAKVTQLLVDVGQNVSAGQVLAKLDARQINADSELLAAQVRRAKTALIEAEVQLKTAIQNLNRTTSGPQETALSLDQAKLAASEAKAQYDRAIATNDIGALSKEEIERRKTAWLQAEARLKGQQGDVSAILQGRNQAVAAAKARLEAAKSDLQVAIAQQNLNNARQNGGLIVAPVSGLITQRNVKVGEIAGMAGLPMFTITSNNVLELMAEVAESEIGRLSSGMAANFKGPDGSNVFGTLRLLPAQIDQQKRTGIAKFTLAPNAAVKSGVFLTGTASAPTRNVTAILASAVIYDAQGSSVFVMRQDNSVIKQKVVLGARQGDLVEIVTGPAVGTWVVTSGASFLADNEKINPTKTAISNPAQPAKK